MASTKETLCFFIFSSSLVRSHSNSTTYLVIDTHILPYKYGSVKRLKSVGVEAVAKLWGESMPVALVKRARDCSLQILRMPNLIKKGGVYDLETYLNAFKHELVIINQKIFHRL